MRSVARLLAVCLMSAVVFAEPAKVAGTWNLTLELENVTGHPVVTLKQDGEKLTGTYEGRYGVSNLEGTIKEQAIRFAVALVVEGTPMTGAFAGKVDGETMSGTVEYEGAGSGTWTATRQKK